MNTFANRDPIGLEYINGNHYVSLNKRLSSKSNMSNDNFNLVKKVTTSEPQNANKREQASEFVSKIDWVEKNIDHAQSKLTDLDSESINDRDPAKGLELAAQFICVGPYQPMFSFPRDKHG